MTMTLMIPVTLTLQQVFEAAKALSAEERDQLRDMLDVWETDALDDAPPSTLTPQAFQETLRAFQKVRKQELLTDAQEAELILAMNGKHIP